MQPLTGKERMSRILRREPVDRVGLFEHFWSDTQKVWTEQGHIQPGEDMVDHFGFDMTTAWSFDMVADLDFVPEVLAETEETIVVKDGNGATLKKHKLHDSTPEHIDFSVKERTAWDELKQKIKPERRRVKFADYRRMKERARETGKFFCWSGVNVFEIMKDIAGHEYMLMGMALDPDWVRDMAMTYAQLTVDLQEMLFAEEGEPDGIWYYEDMGYKQHPFMSPRMYREIVQPAHALTVGYAKSRGLPVIMHSCGYVEPLLPGMLEAGIDCLQVIEVKAGMDLLKLYKDYGEVLSFMGGIDVRKLYTNDRAQIDAELEAKIPTVMQNFGYTIHSDHSIPNTVFYETYRYFIDKGLELGTYK